MSEFTDWLQSFESSCVAAIYDYKISLGIGIYIKSSLTVNFFDKFM